MSGEVVPKLRVVRCPKCRKLLQEPLGYDVYKCGGCGTTLEAKKRRSVDVNSESSVQETDAAPGNVSDLVAEGKDCLKAKATTSSGECKLDGKVGRVQNENDEHNDDQLVPINLCDEELESELDIYKLSLRRRRVSNKGCSDKITHCEIEEIDSGNLLLEGSEKELICVPDEDGNNDKSALTGVKSEKEISQSDSEGAEELNNRNLLPEGAEEDGEDASKDKSALTGAKPEVEVIGSGLEGTEDLNNRNLLLEDAEEKLISGLDGEDANNDKSALVGESLEGEITGSDIAGEKLNNGNLLLEGAEQKLNICAPYGEDPNKDPSAIEGSNSQVDTTESASTIKRSSTEKGSILHVTPGKSKEGTSGNSISSIKQHKQAQKNVHRGSDCVRSMDALDTTGSIDPSSELSGNLGKLSKSPTTRSSHAYDGSLSSYDGMDERYPIQHVDSLKKSYTVAEGVSEGRTRKGKGLVNGLLFGDLGTQDQSHMPNEKHHVMKNSRRNQHKGLEATKHGHRRLMRTKRDEFPSRMPFPGSVSQSRYASNRMHDEVHHNSSFLSPDSREDTDQEKLKLLIMIYKLQDQLNKTRNMSEETNGRLSTGVSYKGNHISAYHSHDLHEGRFSPALDHPRCNGRCNHGVVWHQRHKFSRIPYSSEARSRPHHRSCSQCCSHFSADLPPHVLFQHEELCRSYPGQDCCSSNCSYPFTPSRVPVYGRETKSDDQRHRAPEVRQYLREKQNLARRHHRPVAGGAPFVTCHKCLNLLQLPADFLLYKRAYHQLKCGKCSEVLKFSLQNGSHIVSFSPNAIGPPSSDLNDQSEVISSSFLPSASHANYYRYSYADPISYYDDYGLSVSKSYSSERDPVSLTQFHHLHGSEYDKPRVSRGTFEPVKEKEEIASRYSSTTKAPVEKDESTDLSSNMSRSRKEARPPPKRTTLHRLMGYYSPSQVIRGTRPSVEGKGAILN